MAHAMAASTPSSGGPAPREQTCFYYVVFPSNSPPIVHSNRIPPEHIIPKDTTELETLIDCSAQTLFHEVPHQTLQSVAFPSTFAWGARSPRPPASVFTACNTPSMSYRATPVDSPVPRNSPAFNVSSKDYSHITAEDGVNPVVDCASPTTRVEGPPWNLRVEAVRTASGELRYHRFVMTACFTALITSHIGPMHSMQSRHVAVALVLMCPSSGKHHQFLLQHCDVLRGMLHRCMAFGMRVTQRFFVSILSPPVGRQSPHHTLRHISATLERGAEAVATYHAIRAELAHALSLTAPLTVLHSRTPPFHYTTAPVPRNAAVSPPSFTGPPPQQQLLSVSDQLCNVLSRLSELSEHYLSAVINGLLAVSSTAQRDLAEACDPYASYWAQRPLPSGEVPKHQQETLQRGARNGVGSAASGPEPSSSGATPTHETQAEVYQLHSGRRGRVVIFTQDPLMAQRLIVLAAFLLRHGEATVDVGETHDSVDKKAPNRTTPESMRMYVGAFAGRVRSCRYANTPIQWIAEEYEEAVHWPQLQSAYSPENALLILAPRILLCRRVMFSKTLESTTLWIEQVGDTGEKTEIRSGVPLFQCHVTERTTVQPDPILSLLVMEAVDLHQSTRGVVDCASVLADMVAWLENEGDTFRMAAAATVSDDAMRLPRFPSLSEVALFPGPSSCPLPVRRVTSTESASASTPTSAINGNLIKDALFPGYSSLNSDGMASVSAPESFLRRVASQWLPSSWRSRHHRAQDTVLATPLAESQRHRFLLEDM